MRVLGQVTFPVPSSSKVLWGCKSSVYSPGVIRVTGEAWVLSVARGWEWLLGSLMFRQKDRFLGNEKESAVWKESWMLGLMHKLVDSPFAAGHSRSSTAFLKVEFILIICLLILLVKRVVGKRSRFPSVCEQNGSFCKVVVLLATLMETLFWIVIISTFSLVCFHS